MRMRMGAKAPRGGGSRGMGGAGRAAAGAGPQSGRYLFCWFLAAGSHGRNTYLACQPQCVSPSFSEPALCRRETCSAGGARKQVRFAAAVAVQRSYKEASDSEETDSDEEGRSRRRQRRRRGGSDSGAWWWVVMIEGALGLQPDVASSWDGGLRSSALCAGSCVQSGLLRTGQAQPGTAGYELLQYNPSVPGCLLLLCCR